MSSRGVGTSGRVRKVLPLESDVVCQGGLAPLMNGSSVWWSVAVASGALLGASCGTRARPEPAHPPAGSSSKSPVPEQRASVCPEGVASEPVAVCNLAWGGEFEVRNQSDQPIQLSTRIDVEMRNGTDSWAVTSALVFLMEACDPMPPTSRCMTLAPGARLLPRRWTGFTCSGQCGRTCSGDHLLRGWPLRFVVTSCNGAQRFIGPPFSTPEFKDEPLAGPSMRPSRSHAEANTSGK
jgi:hypothetical protein